MFSSYIFLIIMTQSFAPVKPFDDHVYDSFITVYENNSKSLILQHCERSELRLFPKVSNNIISETFLVIFKHSVLW